MERRATDQVLVTLRSIGSEAVPRYTKRLSALFAEGHAFREARRLSRDRPVWKFRFESEFRYQKLRYGSNVLFRHGPADTVKFSATPMPGNPARALDKSNPNALQDELLRHLKEDGKMSAFDFGVQFLDTVRMTYWGKHYDTNFWTENASINWNESEAPFHSVARLTLLANSQLVNSAGGAIYFDVTGNSTPDSTPVGSINRARQMGEVASRKARTHNQT